MENIAEKLNTVVDYIEDHLTEEIDRDEIARLACCSYYDVGRSFSLLAGIGISDYVRKRRLTQAGIELKHNGARVVDVALKYGYDSPVSFARAFQAFHGFNPSLADKTENVLSTYPRLIYRIKVEGVIEKIKNECISINGKKYEADYLGELDMSFWAPGYLKRKFWRLENAYEEFKDYPRTTHVVPYNNYPPVKISPKQIFIIEYHRADGGEVEREYHISDETVWNGMLCTHEFKVDLPMHYRIDKILFCGNEYAASYLGEQAMSSWSDYAESRDFWRLENVQNEFDAYERLNEVLPYNNYPPLKIMLGQVFLVVYRTKNGGTDHALYVADGTVWRNMPSTRKLDLPSKDSPVIIYGNDIREA